MKNWRGHKMKLELSEEEKKWLLLELTGTHPIDSVFELQSELDKEYKNSIIEKLKR